MKTLHFSILFSEEAVLHASAYCTRRNVKRAGAFRSTSRASPRARKLVGVNLSAIQLDNNTDPMAI